MGLLAEAREKKTQKLVETSQPNIGLLAEARQMKQGVSPVAPEQAPVQQPASAQSTTNLPPRRRSRSNVGNTFIIQSEGIAQQPESNQLGGALETAATIATGALAEPVAGIAGLVQTGGSLVNNLLGISSEDPLAAGADTVNRVLDYLTYKPKTRESQAQLQNIGEALKPVSDVLEKAERVSGDIGYNLFGEVGGALFSALPAAATEILPAVIAPRVAAKVIASRGDVVAEGAKPIQQSLDEITSDPVTLQEMADTLQSADIPNIAQNVAIDPAFYRAADELGINTEPLASFASQNKQFRGIEQGLAAIPGSQLDAQSFAFVEDVARRADRLIEEYGGTLDKAELSERFKATSLETIDSLNDQVENLYLKLDEIIDRTKPVDTANITDFLEKQSREAKGIKGKFANILEDLKPKEVKTGRYDTITGKEIVDIKRPTYGQLSQARHMIGEAIGKRFGVFKDIETGQLKAIYAKLRMDQDADLAKQGILGIQKAADGLVVQRKRLEDNLIKTLGKDLTGSIAPIMAQKIKRLSGGQIDEFKAFIGRIPENIKDEVVVTALNDLMRGKGSGQEALSTNALAKVTGELDRQPTLKAELFKHLPKGAQRDFENIGKLAQGIDRALKDKVKTGVVQSLFDEQAGFLRRMVGGTARATLGAKVGVPLIGTAVEDLLKRKTKRSESVGELLASPQFQQMITEAVKDGFVEGSQLSKKAQKLESLVEKSRSYKAWAEALEQSESVKLANIGLASYLLSPEETE